MDQQQPPLNPDPNHASALPAMDRRTRPDRRQSVVDRRLEPAATGLERRRGPGRRRSDFVKCAEEGQMTPEQFLFISAIDAYKRVNQVPFPTWTQVLEVLRKLGYRKTCPSTLNLDNAEDWTEPADAPAFRPPDTINPAASRAANPDEEAGD